MTPSDSELPILSFESASTLREWLVENYASSEGIWLRIYKKGSGFESVSLRMYSMRGFVLAGAKACGAKGMMCLIYSASRRAGQRALLLRETWNMRSGSSRRVA